MKKYIFIAFATLSVVSCKLDDNISQNDPGVEQVTPDLYLSAAQTSNYNVDVGDIFELSNVWMNNWSGNIYYFASPYSAEYQLQVTSAFTRGNNFWNNSYTAMARYAAIYNNAQVDKYPHHAAIAKILMANSMQYIVDFYGDAPFSEAFKREANLTPKYDKGEDIYRNLVVMINEANAAIDNTTPLFPVGTEDEVYAGNMDEWKRLANTIKLRILLRQSKVTDPTIRSFVLAQLQTLQGADFISETVGGDATINPGYNNSTAQQQNPLIRNYAALNFDQTAENINGYRLIDISSHFAGLLNGANAKTTGTTDARRGVMYRPVTVSGVSTIRGITQGDGQIAGATEASFSRLFWKFREIVGGQIGDTSNIDGYIMTVAESELLQAEAAELYPAIFTNGIGHYNQAIESSFRFFGLTSAAATTYINSLASKPYGWNGSDGHIAAIQYQRMVALHFVKPQETYVNYLKTGFPVTPLALTATQPNKPWRLVYPAREYNTNSANVPNVTQADVFVKNQFTPFWNRN
ncbi:MAG: SusD/RagB family nutrient-binding outer membrane lipoprotein [Flavobacteriales bacterium]|nr:MAG: SusD/RagB family nutrient-binding outer membrane lipoprotein [Flavobacteriales bacterium]